MSETILVDMLGVAPLSQPWLKASFISDQGEYGLNFTWFHSINVFWHALTTGLVFFFVLTVARHLRHQNRMSVNPHYIAAVTAILFACHPLTSEAVTYLSARAALLGTNNYFLSLCFCLMAILVKNPIWRISTIAAALFAGAMAIWSIPEAISLPAVALFTLLIIKRPLAKWKETVMESPFLSAMGLALSIATPCLVLLGVQNCTAVNLMLPTLAPISYCASQIKGFVFHYLPCFAVPVLMSVDPPMAIANGFSDPFVIAGIAILAGLAFLAAKKLKQPILGFATFLILAGFLPHMLMVQPDAVADWVTYLPLSGVMMFAAFGIATMAQRNIRNASIVLIGVVLLFGGLSIYRDLRWASNFTLWESALLLRPKSALGHAMLAIEYLKRQEYDQAEKEAKIAITSAPDLVMARIAQAKVEMHNNKWEKADEMFKAAHALAESQKLPVAIKAECRLGQLECLIGQKKEKDGNSLLTKLIQEMPGDPKLYYVVAQSAFQNRDYEKAFKMFSEAVSNDPSLVECWEPMAECAFALRANEQAYVAAHSYMDTVSGSNSKILVARAALVTKREAEAEEILKDILQKEPKNARAMYLLSRLYKHIDKKDEWKKFREEAIKADPDVSVKFDLPELDIDEAMNPPGEKKDATPSGGSSATPGTGTETGTPATTPTPAPAPASAPTPAPAQKSAPTPAPTATSSETPKAAVPVAPAKTAPPSSSPTNSSPATPKN